MRGSAEISGRALLVFVRRSCKPCHNLLDELRTGTIDLRDRAYLLTDGDIGAAREMVAGLPDRTFVDVFTGATPELLRRLRVPATPYGIVLRDGRVVAAKIPSGAAVLAELVAAAALDD